ncbi:hypothetical protein Aph02nite_13180 [Actinoplanes philippinensis]|nr:hypothetical protein Aph02nite_13180 [Actinoplanes philippinensis]
MTTISDMVSSAVEVSYRGMSMFKWISAWFGERVDPAPNPLRMTVADVDAELATLRSVPGWDRDRFARERADQLLDVRAVLARHEAEDAAQTRPSAASRSSLAYPSSTPTSMPLLSQASLPSKLSTSD